MEVKKTQTYIKVECYIMWNRTQISTPLLNQFQQWHFFSYVSSIMRQFLPNIFCTFESQFLEWFFFTVLAAIFLTCFSCWLKRLLSKRRISKEEAEDGEFRKKDFTGNGPDVVVNFIMRFCVQQKLSGPFFKNHHTSV